MIIKEIKYKDFNGVERSEEFYFNLTEAEIAEMNFSTKGGLEGYLKAIINTQDTPAIAELFKTIINKSYGVKSPDGRKFVKSPEVLEDFIYTQAYSNLYMSLITDPDSAANFVNGIMPEKLLEAANKNKPELSK